jgi:hypothetical protein
MPKFLCKVTDVFKLTGGNLVILTDVLFEDFDQTYWSGAKVELRTTNGSAIIAESYWMYCTPTNFGKPMSLSLGSHLTKEDVPIGTEVWLIDVELGGLKKELARLYRLWRESNRLRNEISTLLKSGTLSNEEKQTQIEKATEIKKAQEILKAQINDIQDKIDRMKDDSKSD